MNYNVFVRYSMYLLVLVLLLLMCKQLSLIVIVCVLFHLVGLYLNKQRVDGCKKSFADIKKLRVGKNNDRHGRQEADQADGKCDT